MSCDWELAGMKLAWIFNVSGKKYSMFSALRYLLRHQLKVKWGLGRRMLGTTYKSLIFHLLEYFHIQTEMLNELSA